MEDDRGVWIGAAVATVALGAAIYYFYIREEPEPAAAPTQSAPTAPTVAQEPPPVRNPVPAAPAEEAAPVPPLAESDPAVRDALGDLIGPENVDELVVPEGIARKFVITVDNLARRKAPVQSRPVAATPGSFRVSGGEENPTLDPENYARYSPAVSLVAKTDARQIAQVYRRFYPRLQEAYGDLGREGAYFNDRVIEVIDHLLATPEVPGPIELVRPKVFYEFKDRELEALSAGQKLLIRMGPQNASVVKSKLQELRKELATGAGDRAEG
jgi:hypothetical protein